MKAFYLVSSQPGEGKTAIIAGLASYFQKQGKKIGYMKPIGLKIGQGGSSDELFFQDFLKLKESMDSLCPLSVTSGEIKELSQKEDLPENILKAFKDISSNKDMVFVEGLSGISPSQPEGRINARLVNKIDAEAIVIANYSWDRVEGILSQVREHFSKKLLGVILNSMSSGQIEGFKETKLPTLTQAGNRILGLIPQDRALASITLGELVKSLGVKPLNSYDGTEELVENIMAGSHGIDPGLYYYGQRDKKVVILRGDRPDMQLAALRTPTLALFLAGESRPYHEVLFQAETTKTPVFSLPGNTLGIIEKVAAAIKTGPFHQMKKVERIEKLIKESLDLKIFS